MPYVWQHESWPGFYWQNDRLIHALGKARLAQGKLLCKVQEERGRSLEGPCQEGRAIFFIFFCQAKHIANAATSCALDFIIFGCSPQCSAPDAHLDQGRSERKRMFSRLKN